MKNLCSYHQVLKLSHNINNFTNSSFFKFMQVKKQEATHSCILILPNIHHSKYAFVQALQYGKINKAFLYSLSQGKSCLLVEYNNFNSLNRLLKTATHFENGISNQTIPVKSRVLWFNEKLKNAKLANIVPQAWFAANFEKNSFAASDDHNEESRKMMNINSLNCIYNKNMLHLEIDNERLKQNLKNVTTLNERLLTLHQSTRITDLGYRLRFFMCSLLEDALSGLFKLEGSYNLSSISGPNNQTSCSIKSSYCHPFGSSINGFGLHDSDCDICLTFNAPVSPCFSSPTHLPNSQTTNTNRKWVFDGKKSLPSDRAQAQRHLQVLADLMQYFLPGCHDIQRILRARVPIVKFNHDKTGLSCDLTIGENGGIRMSDILFSIAQSQPHLSIIFTAIKYWALNFSITNMFPGKWLTNFMLLLLTIHHCQAQYQQSTGTPDLKSANISPDQCFINFFQYFSTFNFEKHALAIHTKYDSFDKACQLTYVKPDFSSLYIKNPVDASLNVAKNVTLDQVVHFKACCRATVARIFGSELRTSLPISDFNIKSLSTDLHDLIYVKPTKEEITQYIQDPVVEFNVGENYEFDICKPSPDIIKDETSPLMNEKLKELQLFENDLHNNINDYSDNSDWNSLPHVSIRKNENCDNTHNTDQKSDKTSTIKIANYITSSHD